LFYVSTFFVLQIQATFLNFNKEILVRLMIFIINTVLRNKKDEYPEKRAR